ncbi:TetR/AcrR family transcriptional regulator [Plastoroseomonas hellenica]|nr:TetR/AcrR family transcriptional regulator [Plastoroseomonas hellenica]
MQVIYNQVADDYANLPSCDMRVDSDMARPREFDEGDVLDAAVECFWKQGFEATSMRDLIERTGITGASLYNAFGDKRALYQRALDHYVAGSIAERIRRSRELPPREAIESFFADILKRSLGDRQRKGCMLVNAAVDVAPHDPAFQKIVAAVLKHLETFFLDCVRAGQADGTITLASPAADLARHLLAVLLGVRVLARVRPEPALLKGAVATALAFLDGSGRGHDARAGQALSGRGAR